MRNRFLASLRTTPSRREDPRRASRAETALAVILSSIAVVVAGVTFSQMNFDAMARRTLDNPSLTGPVAQAQWQETLRSSFEDLSKMPATLPNRGDVGFNLKTEPEPSMLAKPKTSPEPVL
jgi:hypothetical protein